MILSASMPKKCTFRVQMRLFGTQRNSLYKCNHLGGVLEAQDRKSTVFTKKSWNSPQQLKFRQKCFLLSNPRHPRKCKEITKCVTICALNTCSVCKLPWFWGPRTIKSRKCVNSVKLNGFCGKWWK